MFNKKNLAVLSLAAIALFPLDALAAPYGYAPAPAYPPPPAPVAQVERPSPERDGFTFGLALGGGQLEIDDKTIKAETNAGLSLRAGFALSQTFLLQATFDATRADNNPNGVSNGALELRVVGASATIYVLPRLFISTGLGYAKLLVENKGKVSDVQKADSMALLVGAGIELIQTSGFALSLEVRGFGASFEEKKAVGGNVLLGLQWF